MTCRKGGIPALALAAVLAAGCGDAEKKPWPPAEADLATYQACTKDSECTAVKPACTCGLGAPVNEKYVDEIRATYDLGENSGDACRLDCGAPAAYQFVCEAGACAIDFLLTD
jgi:hypothetical protein